jgi:plastocyanin
MNQDLSRRPVGRRTLLGALGVAGGALAFSGGGPEAPGTLAAQEATPSVAAEWTPPPIPRSLPKPGGTPAPLVGAAPAAAAPPSLPQNENPVEEPGGPPQPIASPAATPQPAAAPEPAATVKLTPDFAFDPEKITIKTGQAVRWVNEGRSPETVTGDPAQFSDKSLVSLPEGAKPWDSGVLNSGDDFVHVFDVAGTHRYASMNAYPHPMTGEVDVQG